MMASSTAISSRPEGSGSLVVEIEVGATGAYFLTNSNAPGPADLVFRFGGWRSRSGVG
jgi:hypothetical protein